MPKIFKIKDNIVTIKGKHDYYQNQYFDLTKDVKGFILSATNEEAELLVVGDPSGLKINQDVTKSQDQSTNVEVKNEYFGAIITPFGRTIKESKNSESIIKKTLTGNIDKSSVSILDRVGLSDPIDTGMLVIDTMIPIGKGQRELIIGDRNTGKTTIAINTIINQKNNNVKCIYVAIGQKRSSIINTYNTLKEHGAAKNTIIIFANPDSSAEQFLAPGVGVAMAEAIADQGEDVLIVYDDLTKHANVYREISLSIGKSPGREAYPTDIFFQHSSLLERAGRFGKSNNNGTITALPIVETVQGDLASLIPSNVISITDGQIITSVDMFNNGEYPAINVQMSVSRTGSAVQSETIKKASKGLKAQHAKLYEIKRFAEMSIDMSDELEKKIQLWNGINNILLQFGNKGYSREIIVIMIETFKAGAMSNLKSPHDFSLIIQHFIEKDPVGQKIYEKIKNNKMNKKELNYVIKHILVPLATAESETGNELFSHKEIAAMKEGK